MYPLNFHFSKLCLFFLPMVDDPPHIFSNQKQKKKRSERDRQTHEILDPRFIDTPNVSKHIKNYSFIYPKEMVETLKNREERFRLESELVQRGKKKFYMSKKHLKALERKKRK